MKPNFGDRIIARTDKGDYEGVLMPSPELSGKDTLILKLDNGYNIGISQESIKKTEAVKKRKDSMPDNKEKKEHKKGIPTIAILHTGGTIASKVDYETGGVNTNFTPEELLSQFPELDNIANIKSRLIRNMWSEDMRFAHYNIMAKEIKKEIDAGAEGIIIAHGTDTLHYTAAALSFMLDGLKTPVIIVGAQRSSDRGSSDAAMNLICAAKLITKSDFGSVAICMHGSINDDFCNILPAAKTRKMHTSRRDAFMAVNDCPIARVYYSHEKIEFIKKEYVKKSKSELKLRLINPEIKIGILKAHPNMFAEEVKVYSGFSGLVLEGTGLGQMPVSVIDEETKEHEKIFKAIKKLIDEGTLVAMAPQTIFGRVQMNVYSPARRLQSIGVIGNNADMTPETAFIKLAWLLSNYPKQAKELFCKNLKGELNERLEESMFLEDMQK